MIRLLVRCATLQRYVLEKTNFNILSKNQIVLSSVRQYKINNNVHLKQQSAGEQTNDSNSITAHLEHEQIKTKIVDVIQQKLNCSRERAQQFCTTHSELLSKTVDVVKSIQLLLASGVRQNVILDNPKMLTLSDSQLIQNLNIVKDMKPMDINDFVPLVPVSTSKLLKLKKIAEMEENVVPKNHRIYYISEAMNIEPYIIAKFVSERLFVLTERFNMIDESLHVLLKYIAPIDLLHDLWALRYNSAVIEKKLNRARLGHKERLMPWMIRCTEKKLSTSIKIASDTRAIAGDKSVVKYLSDRLKYNVKTTEAIMQKHPSIFNCRVPRMKEMLDYLFTAGFTPVDIAQTPRVFSHSLNTIKKRVEELKSIDCRPQLFIVCRSANEYNKFVKNWIRVQDKLKQKNVTEE